MQTSNSISELSKKFGDSPLPPIPVPKSLQDLPGNSPKIIVSTSTDKFNLLWDSDTNSRQLYVVDPDPTNTAAANNSAMPSAAMVNWWGQRPAYTMTMRRYWKYLFSTFVTLGEGFNESRQDTYGVVQSETENFSAELGVKFMDLSGKLSASFSTTVTISSQSTEVKTYTYPVNNTPNTKVFLIFWQLMEEYAALDANGNLITWNRGSYTSRLWLDYPYSPPLLEDGALLLPQSILEYPTNTFVMNPTAFNI